MLRNLLINALGYTALEQALSTHLTNRCKEDSSPDKVVVEVDSFLVKNRFTHLLTALNPNVPLADILVDFQYSVIPCLVMASNYKQVDPDEPSSR